jgi:hypothetical protein
MEKKGTGGFDYFFKSYLENSKSKNYIIGVLIWIPHSNDCQPLLRGIHINTHIYRFFDSWERSYEMFPSLLATI